MRKQIAILIIILFGACSLCAQERNDSLISPNGKVNIRVRKKTDWSKHPVGYVFGGMGTAVLDYNNAGKIIKGFNWKLGMSRYYNSLGWGVLVQQFQTKQSAAFFDDKIRLLYVAPRFVVRLPLGEKMTFYGAVGVGWLHYQETLKGNGFDTYKRTTDGVSGMYSIEMDYRLNSTIGLSVDGDIIAGKAGRAKINESMIQNVFDGVNIGKRAITNLSLMVGVHIYFWNKKL